MAGAEQLLLDGDALARGKPFFRLGATSHSPDHRLLAWTSDEPGSEFYTARVRVIDSGADLADSVPDVSGSVVWTQDAAAFYYVRLDQEPPACRRLSAQARNAGERGRARVRGGRSGPLHFSRSPCIGPFRRHFGA